MRRGAHQDLVAADALVGREFLDRGLRPRVEEQLDEHLGLRGHPSTREATTGAVAAIRPAASVALDGRFLDQMMTDPPNHGVQARR